MGLSPAARTAAPYENAVVATDVRAPQKEPDTPPSRRDRTWPERIALALPGVFLAVVFGFFFITKTSEAWTATKSVQAMLLIAAIVVGWVVIAWLLRRFVPWIWLRAGVLSVIAVAIAIIVVRPYYVDEVDNTKVVKGTVQDASAAAAPAEPGAPPAPAPAGPVRVSSGQLRGIDHSASGAASIIRQPDGSYVLRFENFDIEGAPDPVVYVQEGENRENPGGTDLGGLRGNVGTTSDYELPSGTQPGPGWTVLVWCRAFAVPIANATQTAA
jgi:Electron transfer DM13